MRGEIGVETLLLVVLNGILGLWGNMQLWFMNDWEVEMSSHGVEKRVAASGEGEKEEGFDFSLPNGHIYKDHICT
jgi:hypothetical protein